MADNISHSHILFHFPRITSIHTLLSIYPSIYTVYMMLPAFPFLIQKIEFKTEPSIYWYKYHQESICEIQNIYYITSLAIIIIKSWTIYDLNWTVCIELDRVVWGGWFRVAVFHRIQYVLVGGCLDAIDRSVFTISHFLRGHCNSWKMRVMVLLAIENRVGF